MTVISSSDSVSSSLGRVESRPFLKWAGGKGQLLPELLARVPTVFGKYYEPFLGGGALFFALYSDGRVDEVHLSDANTKLMDTYRAVRDEVEAVIAELPAFTNDRELYYRVRSWHHGDLAPARRAARFIYLNKTCYNGLYRENQRGEFNVPFGRYRRPKICDADNLRAAAVALRHADLRCRDFDKILDLARPGDFVYFDPPYHPLSATSSFTSYREEGFGPDEQRRLARAFQQLDRGGVNVMLSNSDTPLIRELFGDYVVEKVEAARSINSKAERRGKISELIVRNYRTETSSTATTTEEKA